MIIKWDINHNHKMAVKHLRLIREAKGVYASRLLNMSIKFAFNI